MVIPVATLTVLLVSQLAPAEGIRLRIEPAKLTVTRFEPIFLRLTIQNLTNDPFKAVAPPTAEAGVVKVQVRRTGTNDYRRVPSMYQNILSLTTPSEPTEQIPPLSSRVANIVLLETSRVQVFSEAGEHEIQVFFAKEYGYPPVTAQLNVQVDPLAQENWEATEATADLIVQQMISGAGIRPPAADSLAMRLNKLPKSRLAAFGKLLVDFAKFRDCNSREEALAALNDIAQFRRRCLSPEGDWVAQRMCELYIRSNCIGLAREEVDRLPAGSLTKEMLESRIMERSK